MTQPALTSEERRVLEALEAAAGDGAAGIDDVGAHARVAPELARAMLLRLVDGAYVVDDRPADADGSVVASFALTEKARNLLHPEPDEEETAREGDDPAAQHLGERGGTDRPEVGR